MTPPNFLHDLPKVELHLHLEGAIPLPTLLNLVQKYEPETAMNLKSLETRFRYSSFPEFIETWVWKNSFLREYEDFTFFAEAVARDLAEQNVIYAEVYYTPIDFHRHGLETGRLTEAIRNGLNQHRDRIEIRLIPDLCRDFGPARGERVLSELAELKEYDVIGIGIGGSEQSFPPGPWADVYARARSLGFRTTVHAGEAAGPESVWEAVRTLDPDRIGHGTRAAEDPKLVKELVDRKIHVELCPLSNLRTAVIPSIEQHPVRRYFEEGVQISVNTDDPKMFNNTLVEEYEVLLDVFGFTKAELISVLRMTVAAAWCSQERKEELLRRIES